MIIFECSLSLTGYFVKFEWSRLWNFFIFAIIIFLNKCN